MPTILSQHTYPLIAIVQGADRGTRANCIYIVRHVQVPIYVGKTVLEVGQRIKQHIQRGDALGMVLKQAAPEYIDWTIEIWHIDSGLFDIEQATITELQPQLNKAGRGR